MVTIRNLRLRRLHDHGLDVLAPHAAADRVHEFEHGNLQAMAGFECLRDNRGMVDSLGQSDKGRSRALSAEVVAPWRPSPRITGDCERARLMIMPGTTRLWFPSSPP